MNEQIDKLVQKAWDKYKEIPEDKRLMIAIAGIPGSGKTTLSNILVARLNALACSSPSSSPVLNSKGPATFVPMDGYHYPRSQLAAMPDPALAFARRGAEFTFDGASFLALVKSLRIPLSSLAALPDPSIVAVPPPQQISSSSPSSVKPADVSVSVNPSYLTQPRIASSVIYAPSFDHAAKDPVPHAIHVSPTHRIVVFEGNYLALDRAPWRDAARLMDELWFVNVDKEVARRRLIKRHVRSGIATNEEEADKRVRENDLVNGDEIIANKLPVTENIKSREDKAWVQD